MKNIHLLLIDFQNDFCNPKGSLYVTGGEKDCERISKLIDKIGDKLNDITLSQDSHFPIHIAHPTFWKDSKGNHPKPFTMITSDDVQNGKWTTTKISLYKWALEYLQTLKKNNRFTCTIWPEHCLIGSEGHCFFPDVLKSVNNWGRTYFAYPNVLTKGSNILTEHYGALEADVPDPNDFTTQLRVNIIQNLETADQLWFAGEASSHCVYNTVRQVVENFSDPSYAKKIKLFKDCMSPVPGFEHLQDELWEFCKQHGIEVVDSKNPI